MFNRLLVTILVLSVLFPVLAVADELLIGDEQSFETGVAPGRWELFTWPMTSSDSQKVASPLGTGENTTGSTITLATAAVAAPGWGSSSLHFTNPTAFSGDNDTGGIYIQLPVVSGQTYTLSANFYAVNAGSYAYGVGFSVDTDGGSTDPLNVDYGYGRPGGLNDEMDSNRAEIAKATGEWIWNQSFAGGQEDVWWGPDRIRKEITATGDQMTVYLWGLSKSTFLNAYVDGVSVDGPPVPTPTGTFTPLPEAGVDRWRTFR